MTLFPRSDSEEVPCPLCGEGGVRVLFHGEGFAMGRCVGCGLVRQNPRLTAAALIGAHYDGAVQEMEAAPPCEDLPSWTTQDLGTYEASVRTVEAVRQQRRPPGPARGWWLDVGAAAGALLVAARDAGYAVGGVEVGAGQVRACREIHGFDVHHGTLEDAAYPDAHAEVVSFRHVLEHLHDPLRSLREARRILQEDGLLLVEVPNQAGLKPVLGDLRWRLRLGRNPWLSRNVPEHLYYFTPRTLRLLLEKAGFQVLFLGTYGRFRRRAGRLRRAYDRLRDALRAGNKLRVVATPEVRARP